MNNTLLFPKSSYSTGKEKPSRKSKTGSSVRSSPQRHTPLPVTAKDQAAFNKQVLEAIYGEYPHCFLGSGNAWDAHHIFGRGNAFGVKKNDPRRVLFSSMFNAAMIGRLPHATCPILNDPNMRQALLKHASGMVRNAALKGDYSITQNDIAFLEFIHAHEARNPKTPGLTSGLHEEDWPEE